MAMKFPHVQTGERVVNPAALENAKRDLVNRFGDVGVGAIGSGFRNAPQWIPCYNAGSTAIQAGRAVNIKWDASGEDATAAIAAGMICVKAYDTDERQIGVARDDMEAGGIGMVAFHGIVKADFQSGSTAGTRYWPNAQGRFQENDYGFFPLGALIDLDTYFKEEQEPNANGILCYSASAIPAGEKIRFSYETARRGDGAVPVEKGAFVCANGIDYSFPCPVSIRAGDAFYLTGNRFIECYSIPSGRGAHLDGSMTKRSYCGSYRILYRESHSGASAYGIVVPDFADKSRFVALDSTGIHFKVRSSAVSVLNINGSAEIEQIYESRLSSAVGGRFYGHAPGTQSGTMFLKVDADNLGKPVVKLNDNHSFALNDITLSDDISTSDGTSNVSIVPDYTTVSIFGNNYSVLTGRHLDISSSGTPNLCKIVSDSSKYSDIYVEDVVGCQSVS